LAREGIEDLKESLDPGELLEIQEAEDLLDNKDQLDNLVWMEFQEQVEKMVYQEQKDHLDQSVRLVHLGQKVLKEGVDHLVSKERMVYPEIMELWATVARKEALDQRDLKESKVSLANVDYQELVVPKDPEVFQDPWD
jgi:hypothetical protein